MYRIKACLTALFAVLFSYAYAQQVSNVRFEQDGDHVIINYDLDKPTPEITLQLSEDGGLSWSEPLTNCQGDVGNHMISAGRNAIIWFPLEERDNLVGSRICFRVQSAPAGKEITVRGVSFQMVFVNGGTFMMGAGSEQGNDYYNNEKPVHQVTLSNYYIGQYEVTRSLWYAVMYPEIDDIRDPNYPRGLVSWDECQIFISTLNRLTGLKFALPTEAQWEYAAKGGERSGGYKYSGSNNPDDVAVYFGYTRKYGISLVGSKLPNELGLYDMSGNVAEWCSDWYGYYELSSQNDPAGPKRGSSHVVRGGNYGSADIVGG